MTIKEKAKRYDEALTKARNIVNSINVGLIGKDSFEAVFPELKESEDEKIRKEIIDFIYDKTDTYKLREKSNSWLTWLEKQGNINPTEDELEALRIAAYEPTKNWSEKLQSLYEKLTHCEQKPTDKVEPKFKAGNWVVNNNNKCVYQVTEIRDNEYCLWPLDAKVMGYLRIIDIDNDCHLWTIQDAKDGDVLVEDSCIFIIQKLGDNSTAAKTYCTLYNDGDFDDGSILYFDIDSTKPATKEQRDTLMKAMADAGWEFDFEKKELRKIEQKPVWSEEDEYILSHIINDLKFLKNTISIDPNYIININDIEREINWFESLKDRVQTKQEWSERDELMLEESIGFIKSSPYPYAGDTLRGKISKTEAINWIKFLKERVQLKQELSEEDEKTLDRVITNYESGYLPSVEKRDKIIEKLKSLKERYTWKPSDEQMEALYTYIYNPQYFNSPDPRMKLVESVYQDLKKLREELL